MTTTTRYDRLHSVLRTAATLVVFAVAIFGARPADACCTYLNCVFCVSHSSECVCGSNHPVCNFFGCNCNAQCGKFTMSGGCVFQPTCSDANAQARFDEVDADHDGKLSLDEVTKWTARQGKAYPQRVAPGELPAKIKRGDKKAILRALFDKVDQNRDGSISPAEFDKSLSADKK